MEDTFGKVVAIFLCVLQLFFIPLYVYRENVKQVEQTYLLSEITYNVDNFRNTGIIEESQYNNMRSRIYALSGNYKIKLVHCTHTMGEEGKVFYDTMFFESDIEDELEKNSVYYLEKSDYLNVYIEDKNGNLMGCYGGAVKNEAY